jgi:hypothetical protein
MSDHRDMPIPSPSVRSNVIDLSAARAARRPPPPPPRSTLRREQLPFIVEVDIGGGIRCPFMVIEEDESPTVA